MSSIRRPTAPRQSPTASPQQRWHACDRRQRDASANPERSAGQYSCRQYEWCHRQRCLPLDRHAELLRHAHHYPSHSAYGDCHHRVWPTRTRRFAFITYTGSGGVLPAYAPSPADRDYHLHQALRLRNGSHRRVVSADKLHLLRGDLGDNLVHIITRSPLTDSSTLAPNLTTPPGHCAVNLMCRSAQDNLESCLRSSFYKSCHPERSLSQSYRERRSRRPEDLRQNTSSRSFFPMNSSFCSCIGPVAANGASLHTKVVIHNLAMILNCTCSSFRKMLKTPSSGASVQKAGGAGQYQSISSHPTGFQLNGTSSWLRTTFSYLKKVTIFAVRLLFLQGKCHSTGKPVRMGA